MPCHEEICLCDVREREREISKSSWRIKYTQEDVQSGVGQSHTTRSVQ